MITPADLAAHASRPRPVPLRASVVAVVVRARLQVAAGLRAVAESNRAAPAWDDYWRDLHESTALDLDRQAHEHERIARVWASRVDSRKILLDAVTVPP